jgi:hypothetical protein
VESEEDIFKHLDMPYKEPSERTLTWGRGALRENPHLRPSPPRGPSVEASWWHQFTHSDLLYCRIREYRIQLPALEWILHCRRREYRIASPSIRVNIKQRCFVFLGFTFIVWLQSTVCSKFCWLSVESIFTTSIRLMCCFVCYVCRGSVLWIIIVLCCKNRIVEIILIKLRSSRNYRSSFYLLMLYTFTTTGTLHELNRCSGSSIHSKPQKNSKQVANDYGSKRILLLKSIVGSHISHQNNTEPRTEKIFSDGYVT